MVDNKKGQGLPTSTLVMIIIAVVVLVFVILGFTTGFGYIFDKIGLLPDDLTSAVQACEQYSGSEALKISYCEYRELTIDGQKGYYNCPHVKDKAIETLGAEEVKWGTGINCAVTPEQFCENRNLAEETIVNGFSCPEPASTEAA